MKEFRKGLMPEDKVKLLVIERHVETLFGIGTPKNPYFTLHGPPHIKSVENHLQSIIESSKCKLDRKELFLLLAATWFHDTGMVNSPREIHHLKCPEFVEALKDDILFKNEDVELKYIGLIGQGHRKVDLNDQKYDPDLCGDHKIRIGFLAALLRLADELDLDFRRAPRSLREIIDADLDAIGKLHWAKHYYVKGIDFSSEMEINKKIFVNVLISFRVPDGKHEEILGKLIMASVEKVLKETQVRLQDDGVRIRVRCQGKIENVERLPADILSLAKTLSLRAVVERSRQIDHDLEGGNYYEACNSIISHIDDSLSSISPASTILHTSHFSAFLPPYLRAEISFAEEITSQLHQSEEMQGKITERNCRFIRNIFQDFQEWFSKEILGESKTRLAKRWNNLRLESERKTGFTLDDTNDVRELIMDLVSFKCSEVSGLKLYVNDVESSKWDIYKHVLTFLSDNGFETEEVMKLLHMIKSCVDAHERMGGKVTKEIFKEYISWLDNILRSYQCA